MIESEQRRESTGKRATQAINAQLVRLPPIHHVGAIRLRLCVFVTSPRLQMARLFSAPRQNRHHSTTLPVLHEYPYLSYIC